MNIKKSLILLFVVLISGCSNQYTLKISDNKVEEKIQSIIYDKDMKLKPLEGMEPDDELTPYIENDQYPLFDNLKVKYKKEVNVKDDYKLVTLKHTYSIKEYKESKALKLCFPYAEYEFNKKFIYIKLEGENYCQYGEKIDINIVTNNTVMHTNAQEVHGNRYSWHLSRGEEANIEIKIKKRNILSKIIIISVSSIAVILIIIVSISLYNKNKSRDDF